MGSKDAYTAAVYPTIRGQMAPGDIIAFRGRGLVSRMVCLGTWSNISHIGIVSFSGLAHGTSYASRRYRVKVTESTSLDGQTGVFTRYMSDVVKDYKGCVWWIPLGARTKARLNLAQFYNYIHSIKHAKYDFWQCARAGFKSFFGFNLGKVEEDSKRVFCSEAAAHALEFAGAWDWDNASLIKPTDLLETPLFSGRYCQLKGSERVLSHYQKELPV